MNEASVWRLALAMRIALHYRANPNVRAVAIAGSVARGYADRFSDIDLLVCWAAPPAVKERRDIIKRAGGR
jgi:predicted nucleotidyltransferase